MVWDELNTYEAEIHIPYFFDYFWLVFQLRRLFEGGVVRVHTVGLTSSQKNNTYHTGVRILTQ